MTVEFIAELATALVRGNREKLLRVKLILVARRCDLVLNGSVEAKIIDTLFVEVAWYSCLPSFVEVNSSY